SNQGVEIKSTLIKIPDLLGGSWAIRFTGPALNDNMQNVLPVYYFCLESDGTPLTSVKNYVDMARGRAPDFGKFPIGIVPTHSSQYSTVPQDLRDISRIRGRNINRAGLKVPKAD
ncbi:hypothetical protein GGH92_009305, partial [Coemansia sp. RSA 2673]